VIVHDRDEAREMLDRPLEEQKMKKVTVVDADIDIFNDREVEWAEATRFQASRSLLVVNNAAGSSLDPSAHGTTSKVAIDATKPFGEKGYDRAVL